MGYQKKLQITKHKLPERKMKRRTDRHYMMTQNW